MENIITVKDILADTAVINELKELIETTFGYDASKITYKKPGEYLTFTASDSDNTKKETASSTASSSSSDKKTSKPTSTAQDNKRSFICADTGGCRPDY